MGSTHTDTVILSLVLLGRLLLPLLIPRYPFPAILACLALDAADQTIFALFTGLDLAGYQSYDKALDIWYLSIAMLATQRNWDNFAAVSTARALFYFRLLGVLLFELTQARVFLLLFPNVFEFFFIFYEGVRCYWSPARLRTAVLQRAVALFWVLKVGQEYWLHIGGLDLSALIKRGILGSPANNLVGEGLAHLIMLAVAAVCLVGFFRALRRLCGPVEHTLRLAAAPLAEPGAHQWERGRYVAARWRVFDRHLAEKLVLVGFVSVIFAQMLPRMNITTGQLLGGVTVFVTLNTFARLRYARAGRSVESDVLAIALLGLANLVLAFVAQLLIKRGIFTLPGPRLLFFLLLLTLLVTLYDRWRPVYDMRFPAITDRSG